MSSPLRTLSRPQSAPPFGADAPGSLCSLLGSRRFGAGLRARVVACALVLVQALACSGCERIRGLLPREPPRPIESYVGEPHTLAALRARATELGARFEQHERNDRGQGSACHGGVCLIIAPALLVHVLFPDRWVEATVEGPAGTPRYHGKFRSDGRLLALSVEQGTSAREIALLELPALGRRVVVETGHRELAEPDWTLTPIVGQVDLRPAYTAAERRASNAAAKAEVLSEAVRVLDSDALPLLASALQRRAPQRGQLVHALIMATCRSPSTSAPVCAALIAHAAQGAGHEAAQEAIACAKERGLTIPTSQLRALSAQVIGGYCAVQPGGDEWPRYNWMSDAHALDPALTPSASVLAACHSPVRRSAVRLVYGLPLQSGELAQLFASPERDAFDVAHRLPCEREPIVALAEQAALKHATPAVAQCLAGAERMVAPAALAAIAGAYPRSLADFNASWASAILRAFRAAAADSARTAAARAVLERARAGADKSLDVALQAALLCLGASQHAEAIARAREQPGQYGHVVASLLDGAVGDCMPASGPP